MIGLQTIAQCRIRHLHRRLSLKQAATPHASEHSCRDRTKAQQRPTSELWPASGAEHLDGLL